MTTSDEELILMSKAHQNKKGFERLYKRHYRDVFCFIQKRVNDKSASAEITQQVFLEGLKRINKYASKDHSFVTHLFQIAVDHCNRHFETKKETRFVVVDEQFGESLMDQLSVTTDRPSKIEKLKNTLRQLSIGEIQLLELRFFERKSFREGGYIMKISESLAKLKTYRLLSKMHKLVNS